MVSIRLAEPRDADALWRVELETAASTFRGMMSEAAHLRLLRSIRRKNEWPGRLKSQVDFTFVAEDDGQIVGYANAGPARPLPVGWDGELYLLYVLHSHQRRGIGRTLVLAVARRLAEQGMRSMAVWSLATNEPSRRFYEALGAGFVQQASDWHWWGRWPIAVYGWKPLSRLFEVTGEAMPVGTVPETQRRGAGRRLALAGAGAVLTAAAALIQTALWRDYLGLAQLASVALFASGLALLARAIGGHRRGPATF